MTIEEMKERIEKYMQEATELKEEENREVVIGFYEGKAFAYAVCLNLLEHYVKEEKSQ
jgi:predicted PP-loop superfamily ATPase